MFLPNLIPSSYQLYLKIANQRTSEALTSTIYGELRPSLELNK